METYKGFSLERNASGYIEATSLTPYFQHIIPFRSHEDARRGIDILWTKLEKETNHVPAAN